MTKKIFLEWMIHFKKNVPKGISKENKHLLICDGHKSHILLEAMKYGLEMGLNILILLADTIHELQSLDVAIFHRFKLNIAVEERNDQ